MAGKRTIFLILLFIMISHSVPDCLPTSTAFRSFQLSAPEGPELQLTLDTNKESRLKRSLIIFLSSLPLTLTYSLLAYKWYMIFATSDPTYPLSKAETTNVLLVGVSISAIFVLWDILSTPGG